MLNLETDNSKAIFGELDSLKLQSSMTLFASVDTQNEVFNAVIDKFFHGYFCQKTLLSLGNPARFNIRVYDGYSTVYIISKETIKTASYANEKKESEEAITAKGLYEIAQVLDRNGSYPTRMDCSGVDDDAIPYILDKAIELESNFISAYLLKASFLNRYKSRLECYDDIIELFPNDIRAYLFKGAKLIYQKKYNLAMLFYDKVLSINPEQESASAAKCHCLFMLNKWQETIDVLDSIIEISPNYCKAHYRKGNCL
ncbi:MAG: DUF1810 family protein, partial [Candidatus Cloacimonetes bacterium]|nr:DUF1810 family protein [Candidatus Cloacimonadota bacterium]